MCGSSSGQASVSEVRSVTSVSEIQQKFDFVIFGCSTHSLLALISRNLAQGIDRRYLVRKINEWTPLTLLMI